MGLLRSLRAEDSDSLFKWINDRDVVVFNAPYKPITRESHEEWFRNIIRGPSDAYYFAIEDQSSTNSICPVGSCSIRGIDHISRSAEIQIRIGVQDARGKGLGTQAIMELCGFGFNDLNLNRIYLDVLASNQRALRCYQKCGFTQEGVKRQAYFIDGAYVDVIFMSLLRSEYRLRKPNEGKGA